MGYNSVTFLLTDIPSGLKTTRGASAPYRTRVDISFYSHHSCELGQYTFLNFFRDVGYTRLHHSTLSSGISTLP